MGELGATESIQNSIDACNQELLSLKAAIKGLEQQVRRAATKTPDEAVKKNQYMLLLHKYLDLMNYFQQVQQRFREHFKQRVVRQVKIVKPYATDEEVQEVVRSGVIDVFANEACSVSSHQVRARDVMMDIQMQHEEILRIEKNICQLQSLFVDIQALVEAQGELVTNIEANVQSTEYYMEKGVMQMKYALRKQNRWRKVLCWLIFVALLIAGVVLGVVFGVILRR